MSTVLVERDERTTAVENASYRLTYLFLAFGLLAVVAVRSFVWKETSWDLLALVVVSGFVSAGYQGYHQVLNRQWVWGITATMVLAAVMAIILLLAM
jgi:hypothetical protein